MLLVDSVAKMTSSRPMPTSSLFRIGHRDNTSDLLVAHSTACRRRETGDGRRPAQQTDEFETLLAKDGVRQPCLVTSSCGAGSVADDGGSPKADAALRRRRTAYN